MNLKSCFPWMPCLKYRFNQLLVIFRAKWRVGVRWWYLYLWSWFGLVSFVVMWLVAHELQCTICTIHCFTRYTDADQQQLLQELAFIPCFLHNHDYHSPKMLPCPVGYQIASPAVGNLMGNHLHDGKPKNITTVSRKTVMLRLPIPSPPPPLSPS